MIEDVDTAVRNLIRRRVVQDQGVEVVFDAPTRDWAARRNAPTVNVFLYDIREDLRRREGGRCSEYDPAGRVTARRPAPRYFRLSYLVTAWTQRPEDEHRLLSELLACFLQHDVVPSELLEPRLREPGLPVSLTVGLPPSEGRAFADVWSALGGELKPSLDVVVVAPVDTGQREPAGPPVTVPPTIVIGGTHGLPPQETRGPAAAAGAGHGTATDAGPGTAGAAATAASGRVRRRGPAARP